jgi:hypothetical protein
MELALGKILPGRLVSVKALFVVAASGKLGAIELWLWPCTVG